MPTQLFSRPLISWSLAWLCLFGVVGGVDAVDSFETPVKSWALQDHDGPLRVLRHQRVFDQAHSGVGCELIEFNAGQGTYFHVSHRIVPSLIHPELRVETWVKAERPGAQLLVRVVLPHTQDARTGNPATLLVGGGQYALNGQWQQLDVADIGAKLERQLRARRAESNTAWDAREAYVDMVVLNAYQGPNLNRVWLDDLDVIGRVEARTPAVATAMSAQRLQVEVRGDVLLIDGAPRFLRMARYRGESMAVLRELGFNAVYTDLPATASLLAEAKAQQLYVIAAPQRLDPQSKVPPLGQAAGHLIAWTTGPLHRPSQFAQVPRTAAFARNLAPENRPVVGDFHQLDRSAAQAADIMLLGDVTRHTSIAPARYQAWLTRASGQGRLRAPRWARLELDPAPRWQQQLEVLGLDMPDRLLPSYRQLRHEALLLLSTGVRGILVDTRRPLEANANSPRAALVRMLNAELTALAPWFAGGQRQTIRHPDQELGVTQFSTKRSRLLLAFRLNEDAAYVDAPQTTKPLSLVAPPMSGSSRGFRITQGKLETIYSRRVPGGDHVLVDKAASAELLVLSQDPLVMNHLARTLNENLAAKAKWLSVLAYHRLGLTAETGRRLNVSSRPDQESLEQARVDLQEAQDFAASGNHQGAVRQVRQVLDDLAKLQHSAWKLELAGRSPHKSPALASFATLPLHNNIQIQTRAQRWSPNLLPAANLESLDEVLRAGWVNRQDSPPHWHTDVSFIHAAQDGHSCLRLASTCTARNPEPPSSPLVTVHSAPVQVRAGQLVRVSGWVKIPEPLNSLDGLLIYDNIGGRELGLRFHASQDWTRFEFIRASWTTGPLVVTWELTDRGEVWLDEVEINVHSRGPTSPAASTARR